MKLHIIGVLLACMMLIGGCHRKITDAGPTGTTDASSSVTKSIDNQKESVAKIEDASTVISKNADEIGKNAASIDNCIDDIAIQVPNNPQVAKNVEVIRKNADTIAADAVSIKDAAANITTNATDVGKESEKLAVTNKDVKKLEDQIVKLKNEKEALQNEAIKKLYGSLSFFFGIAFLAIIAGGIIAFFVDKKLGMMIAGIGIFGIALAAGAIFYLKTIALIGMGIIAASLAICVGLGIYAFVKKAKTVETLHQANVENVSLIEAVKEHLDPAAKVELFGHSEPVAPSIAQQIQSPATQQIVAKIKGSI